jgi:hypothetical protein
MDKGQSSNVGRDLGYTNRYRALVATFISI